MFVRQKQKEARSSNSADLILSTCLGLITVRSKDGQRCCLQRLCALQLKYGGFSCFNFFGGVGGGGGLPE